MTFRAGGGEAGEEKLPDITFQILDAFANVIPEGQQLQVGDSIFLDISLVKDGTYSSVTVLSCVASNKPNLYDMDAFSTTVVDDG